MNKRHMFRLQRLSMQRSNIERIVHAILIAAQILIKKRSKSIARTITNSTIQDKNRNLTRDGNYHRIIN